MIKFYVELVLRNKKVQVKALQTFVDVSIDLKKGFQIWFLDIRTHSPLFNDKRFLKVKRVSFEFIMSYSTCPIFTIIKKKILTIKNIILTIRCLSPNVYKALKVLKFEQ